MSSKNKPILKSSIKIGLTIGDPAGIGPAITLKAVNLLKNKAEITVIGSSFVLEKSARLLRMKDPGLNLISLNNIKQSEFKFGQIKAQNGKASLDYLDTALALLKEKEIDCLVTCPISKEAINMAGSNFSGHTEYFAKKCGIKNPVMMLLNDKLKFSLLTRHLPLKEVSKKISKELIGDNIEATIKGLKEYFKIKKPKIALCGINPHASDNGVIGNEEKKIFVPAIKKFKDVAGPLPADIAIARAVKGDFDCLVVPYHDQALIALKLTGFDSGINMTLGLGFVRTSPLHGTAFDIANNPLKANPNSLICAINFALKCASNQKKA